jgi:hypothetical protein
VTGVVTSAGAGGVSVHYGAPRTDVWFENGVNYAITVHDFTAVNVGQDGYIDATITASVVPEPVTMVLMGTGLAGLGMARRRRRRLEQADLV